MSQENTRKNIMKRVEIIFDISYLLTVLISAGLLYKTAETGSLRWQYALMAFILGFGDAFHLIPRIYAMIMLPKSCAYVAIVLMGFTFT